MGKIILYTGCMFSQKTSTLFSYIKKCQISGKKYILIRYSLDKRYDTNTEQEHLSILTSHDKVSVKSKTLWTLSLPDPSLFMEYDYILIDEGQFFDTLPQFCDTLANYGKVVVVAGLDGTYDRTPFKSTQRPSDASKPYGPSICNLLPLAEEVHKLRAICTICGEDASFSKLLDKDNHDPIIIGGSEKYAPRCRRCFSS